ncbi:unnamed protein product [Rhizophagus irregularis]|nr:unnamed protein product [Rhizophagus irregularis]
MLDTHHYDLHTFSLVQLTHQINARIEEEKRYTEFENEKNRNIVTGIPRTNEKFFEPILQVLKKFLTPNLLNIAKKEILESILYEATCMDLNLIDTLDVEYLPENDSIEGKFGWKQTLVKALLSKILKSLISEIWAVQLSIGAQPWLEQHVILLADGNFLYLSDIRGGNVFTPILKEVVSKRQQYAKAHELQKKIYNLATRIGQESEYINLLKNFIHTMEISLEEVANEKENSIENQKITNSIYIKPRGKPP